tara:strand:- start:8919 stop:9797 length:879 start_codon:yes stop_codon:yes gene_type:complete
MTCETESFETETGHSLQRYWFTPTAKPIGGLIMVHGLGDHLGRYRHVAELFCKRGFLCVGVDLPGHGHSSGARGHVPSFEMIGDLLDRDCLLLRGRLPEGAPLGLFAHSMGGLVALDYLPRRIGLFEFAWISSPLIDPSERQPQLLVKFSQQIGPWLPWLSLGTGVRSEWLHHGDPKTGVVEKDPLMHSRVSASFGAELLQKGASLPKMVEKLDGKLRLLMTHGSADHICSPQASRQMFELLPVSRKAFITVEDSLHEPLHDRQAEWLMSKVELWLNELGFPSLESQDSTTL